MPLRVRSPQSPTTVGSQVHTPTSLLDGAGRNGQIFCGRLIAFPGPDSLLEAGPHPFGLLWGEAKRVKRNLPRIAFSKSPFCQVAFMIPWLE